ncbi:SET domain containing protein, putative [Babesia bigemina]|uniref:SET domain containing protein, putative n=1 Tax=Babesia bigemina TaxID=5866 RepID=A0A061DBN9_BABBI|nr:SET domain containing protein, putative [Babesia bigemina]CDR97362.1 SET domain containing protein, putative [Babesia bigemina]|eukprot:XP_012769548.1 SET domain containing protein, putative [Babesia bigemina]
MVTTVGIKGKKPKDGIYALKQLVLESAPPEFLPFREDVLGYIRSVGSESEASDVWISKLAPRLLGDDEPVPDLAAVHRASAKRSGTAKGSNADLNAADGSVLASGTPDVRPALSGDAPVPEGNSWDIENALGAAIHSFMAAGAAKALGNTTSSHAPPATQGTPFGAPGVRSMQSQVLGNITENQRRASFEKLLESLNNSGDDEKDPSGPAQKAKPATGMDGGKDALPGGLGAALTHAATTRVDNAAVLASNAIKLPVPPRVNPVPAAVAVGSIAGAGLGSTAVVVDPSQLADPAAALSRSHAQPEKQALERGKERPRSVRAKSKESSQPGTPFSRKDEVIDCGSPVVGEHLAEVDTDLLGGDAAGKRGLRKLNARRIVDRKLVWPLNCWVCREPMDRMHPYVVCNSTCKRAYHASCEAIAALKLRLQIKPIDVETPALPRGRSARGAARGRGRSSVRASSRKGNVGAPDSLSPERVPGSADGNYTAGMEGSSLQEAYASAGRIGSTDSAPRLRASGSGSAASRAGSVSEHATGLSGRDASLRGIGAVDGTRNRHAANDNDKNELEVSTEWRKLVPSSTGWTRVTPNCISRECSFCINSYAGCSACFKFVAIKDLCRCAMDGCSTFYCYPACLRQVRLVVPDVQIMEIHQLVYGNVDRLLDENKRPIFICHGHTCWSCYDCDRYSYLWETLWRIEANRSETDYMNTAWQDLRKTCRGKVETAHFAKGKKLTRPLVYPDLRLYKTYMQSRRFAIHGVSGSTASKTLYPPSDDEDRATFHQVTSNVLMRCVRCERTWCTHCLHPDVRILQNSGKQMICQDCIHVEMVQALSQDRVERSSQHELIDPKVMVPSRHPLDVYNTVSSYIASQGLYQSKLAVKPHFLDPGSFYHVPDAAELAATCPRKIRSDAGKTRARGAAASKAVNADGADKVNDCKREAIDVVPRAKADGASASGGKRGAQNGPKGEKSSANATGSAPGVKGASGTKTNVDTNAATTPKNLVKTEGSSSASLGNAGATRVTSGSVDGGAVNQPAMAEKANGSELIRQGGMAAAVNTVSTGLNLSNAMGQPPVMPGGLPNPAAQVTAAMSPTNATQAGAGGAQVVVGEFGASVEIPVGSAEALDGQQLPAQGEKRRRGRPRNSTEKSPSSARQAKLPQEGGDTPVQEGEEVQRRKYVRRAKTEKGLKPAKTTKASKSGRSEMSSDDEGDARPKRATRPTAVRHPLIASSRRELRAQVRTRLNRMHSKEFNVMVREVDPLVVLRLCSEFRYMTSNLITDDSLRSISGVQASTKCSCTYGCSSTCANIARHVECNNVNCNLGDFNCGNRRFKHMGIPKLRLRMVEGKGMGAFAAEDIDEDELVCEYVGRVITQAQFQRCVSSWSFAELDNANQSHWYIMKVHKDVYIDSTNMGNVARFINHSCEPNCSSVPFYVNGTFRMGVFAQRRIAKGEEVTYNYGFSSRGVGGGFKCLCGAKNCRGIVGVQPDTTAETLQEIEIAKASGLEYDTLSQLMYDIASMHGCKSDVSSMKNSPSPIDILNGIRTTGDLYRYEKSQTRLRLKGESDLGSGLVMPISPVTLVVEDSMQLKHSQLNYAKLLVLGGRTMKEWDMANTKEFAAGIPWGIIALENNKATMTKSLESGCAFPDFYSRAKRYIQTMCMALSRQCAGNQGCENVQSLMDLTWGATEPCYVCNGYGDCKNCDHCGDVLHDDNACGDFYVNRAGMNLCNVCQNSDHRLAWLLSSDIAKESMAMRLWRLRMEMAYRQSRATFRSLVAQHKASANESAETGGSQSRVYLRPEALLCTRRELERFNKSPTAFYDMQVKYHTQCQNALSNYECFW